MFVPFSGLAAPPVPSAGRGRAQQHRGAHSTCKLILEMCASFLILKFLNPHIFYVYLYDYPYHHNTMHANQYSVSSIS